MATPHKHAAMLKAWADGAAVQFRDKAAGINPLWQDCTCPFWWVEHYDFRLKPLPPPDVVDYRDVAYDGYSRTSGPVGANLKLTFDGETGELKAAEVLK